VGEASGPGAAWQPSEFQKFHVATPLLIPLAVPSWHPTFEVSCKRKMVRVSHWTTMTLILSATCRPRCDSTKEPSSSHYGALSFLTLPAILFYMGRSHSNTYCKGVRDIKLGLSLPWTETLTVSFPKTIDVDLGRELAL
jgi:hypothetical protein